jgi:hypothetical protein
VIGIIRHCDAPCHLGLESRYAEILKPTLYEFAHLVHAEIGHDVVLSFVVKLNEPGAECGEFEEVVLFVDYLDLDLGMGDAAAIYQLGFCFRLFATNTVFGFVVLFVYEAVLFYPSPEFLRSSLMMRIGSTDEVDILADAQNRQ